MAKNKCVVYLGYEDEAITDKNKSFVDYKTNKCGGFPDWPFPEITVPPCPLCGLIRPLIVQIYAPLENSQFHRTLFIFSCINPNCSNQSQSWICVRSQILEKHSEKEIINVPSKKSNITWCNGSDEWDEPENQMSTSDNENCNEENGNLIKNDNRMSDEDEESNSLENDPIPNFGNLNVDDKNANCGGAQGGAVGNQQISNIPTAEIEGEESELVTIETPITPQRDLVALLKQTPAIPSDLRNLSLKSFFISVDEEHSTFSTNISEHVRDLLQEYQSKDEGVRTSPDSPGNLASGGGICEGGADQEFYEKENPAHGDLMFHNFLTRIQENPGQILRYSRESSPLLISPMTEVVQKCSNCNGDVICEIQILPTIIPKLKLENNDSAPLEFGNILVFTCIKNCWDTPDKMRIENVVVQQEI